MQPGGLGGNDIYVLTEFRRKNWHFLAKQNNEGSVFEAEGTTG